MRKEQTYIISSHFIAVVAAITAAAGALLLPFEVRIGGGTSYYEPLTLLIVAGTALVAIWASMHALRQGALHRKLIGVLVLPLSVLLIGLSLPLMLVQYYRLQ